MDAIIAAATALRPSLLVVDSIQTVALDDLDGPAGSVGQVRESAARLGSFARDQGVPVLLVGHVTKDGTLAGPRTLEHLVDAVLMLDGDRYASLRLLRALKNRHGSTDEVGVMEMTPDGPARGAGRGGRLPGARDRARRRGCRWRPSSRAAAPCWWRCRRWWRRPASARRAAPWPGSTSTASCCSSPCWPGAAAIDVVSRDVYASLTGGITVSEPALDLPLALAIAASQRDQAIAGDLLACGEVSLLGEVRPVPGLERRLREAARAGFRSALVPDGVWPGCQAGGSPGPRRQARGDPAAGARRWRSSLTGTSG